MTAERFRRQREWFDRALDAGPAGRAAVLEACRAEDAALAAEVERLLGTHAKVERVRTAPAVAAAAAALDASAGPAVGSRAGVYRLEELIGSGGMGRVYRAGRVDGVIEQEVAIKLLRREALNPALLRRFSVERQVLASLNHPGIARLLDAAATEDGTPYVVMELVRGEPLLRWCDARRLSIDERLRLFLQVLDAVTYAHRSLVVHRDLKSSNILVDQEGHPKLLDFGIAKPISPGIRDHTLTAERFFTPSTAAPEQVRGDPVTVGVDVYALGVLLHELLCGKPPFDLEGLSAGQVEELILRIPPPTMSARLAADDLPLARARGGMRVDALRRRLRDDLDPIVERCLRKDARERYASVEQLAADLSNALAGRPVGARTGRRWYRLRKFVRRNVVAVGLGLSALLLALSAGVVITRQSILVAQERDRATLERDRARQAVDLLKRAFAAADPSQTGGAEISARQVLIAARPELELTRESQPDLYVELAGTLAEVEMSLGLFPEARQLADRAAGISAAPSVPAEQRARLLLLAARAAIQTAEYQAAESALSEAAAIVGESDEVRTTRGILRAQQGRYDESVTELRAALAGLQAAGPDNALAVRARQALAETFRLASRWTEGLQVLDATLTWQRKGLPTGHPDVARTRVRRAALLRAIKRVPEAIVEARAALTDLERVYGPRSTAAASAHTTLGNALRESDDQRLAANHLEAALSIWQDVLGADNPQTLRAQFNLAQLYLSTPGAIDDGRLEAIYRDTYRRGLVAFGQRHATSTVFKIGLAEFLLAKGRPRESLALLVKDGAEGPLMRAGPDVLGAYADALWTALDRSGCQITSNSSKGPDRTRVLELLPKIRDTPCAHPRASRGP